MRGFFEKYLDARVAEAVETFSRPALTLEKRLRIKVQGDPL